MNGREEALAQIVALAEQHEITHQDVRRALAERGSGASKTRQGVLGTVFAYIGGTLVLAGVCVFVAMQWNDMGSLERIVVTLGPGLGALVLAHLASLSEQRAKLVTPLFLIGVLVEPLGIVVALQELSNGGNETLGALAVSGVMAVQCALVFARMRRGMVLFALLVFGGIAVASALALLELDGGLNALVVGVSYLLVTIAIARTEHEPITPLWFAVAAALILGSWFEMMRGKLGEFSEIVLAGGFVYLSTVLRSRTLLAAGTLGVLAYIGYFSGRHFANSLGWPVLLIALGIVMMLLGTAAVRIHRRYIKAPA